MKKVKTFVFFQKKKIELEVFNCNFIEKGIGLMFMNEKNAKILQFSFNELTNLGIHSFFVYFDFLAVWIDNYNKVIQVDYVKPWTKFVRCKKNYKRLIEIPVNSNNTNLIKKFR
jgi:uncharacterized membrane protein (UPF0127 family)